MKNKFIDLLRSIPLKIKEVLPSEFAEKYRKLGSDVSTVQGKFRYKLTPYLKEIVDSLQPSHPAQEVAVMKSAQIGFTEGVVVNGILWIISENPGNIMALSANDQLSKEMVESRLDSGIASCGMQDLIRPNTIRKRNNRTGDTSSGKEFAGGRLFAGGLQSVDKLGKQRSIRYGFFDDWDAAPLADKKQGSIKKLITQRFATAANTRKVYYISTPETKPSNIENAYLEGDQRKWNVPCPCCGEYIPLIWKQIKYKLLKNKKLDESSVHYECQLCEGTFKEDQKYTINLKGKWIPTAEPKRPGYYSYHINALTAAPHMYGWTHYVYEWMDIFKNGNESASALKTFMNLVLGEPWEERVEEIKSNKLQQNVRRYDFGNVPQTISERDGNGRIVILTCACDLNGTVDDARLDWEIVGHTETGSIYCIEHGSIGTYQPKAKGDRQKWTYKFGVEHSVWDVFQQIIDVPYPTDEGEEMNVVCTAVDTGHESRYANVFIQRAENKNRVFGARGRGEGQFVKLKADAKPYKISPSRPYVYNLEVNALKNELAERINLEWDNTTNEVAQPEGYINFPIPEPRYRKYDLSYFKQYEAEQRTMEVDADGEEIGYKWVRKYSSAANHFFDCMVYNLAIRDIWAEEFIKHDKNKKKYEGWSDIVSYIWG
jgi:phage terminase large subunit GpA-like protein